MGQSTLERVVEVARPDESDDRGVNRGRREGSKQTARGATADDASRGGPPTALAYVLIIGTPTRFDEVR